MTEAKVKAAAELKQAGTELFKAGDFAAATAKYGEAAKLLLAFEEADEGDDPYGEDGDDAEAMRREDAQTRFLLRRASSGLSGVESLATYVEPPEMATKKRYKIAGA